MAGDAGRAAVGMTVSCRQVRPDAVTVGVCFAPQVVIDLPTDEHDVTLHAIVTD